MKNLPSTPVNHGLRFVVIMFLVQLFFSLALVGWWGYLLWRASENTFMIATEGFWFLSVIAISGFVLFRLYLRDIRRSRSIQAFFASLTHELKTPLTSIRLQAESIADAVQNDGYTKSLADRLLQDTSRLEAEVERTLELARVEGGGPVLSQGLPLKSLVTRLIDSWSENRAGVKITAQMREQTVIGDVNAISIIMRNLLDNSMKHSKRSDLTIDIRLRDESDNVVLEYVDNGVARHSSVQNLGELFAKGPESSGAGVGLYLVRALMSKMGGKVNFDLSKGFHASLYFRKGETLG